MDLVRHGGHRQNRRRLLALSTLDGATLLDAIKRALRDGGRVEIIERPAVDCWAVELASACQLCAEAAPKACCDTPASIRSARWPNATASDSSRDSKDDDASPTRSRSSPVRRAASAARRRSRWPRAAPRRRRRPRCAALEDVMAECAHARRRGDRGRRRPGRPTSARPTSSSARSRGSAASTSSSTPPASSPWVPPTDTPTRCGIGVMALNVRAPFRLMRAAFPYLKERQGAVVNVSSVNGRRVFPEPGGLQHQQGGARPVDAVRRDRLGAARRARQRRQSRRDRHQPAPPQRDDRGRLCGVSGACRRKRIRWAGRDRRPRSPRSSCSWRLNRRAG